MAKIILRASFLFAFIIFLSLQGPANFETSALHPSHQVMNTQEIHKSLNVSPDYGRIPLYFIPNEGQVDEKALFYAKTSRYTLWLTKEGLVFDSIRRKRRDDERSHLIHPRQRKKPRKSTYKRDVTRMLFLNAKLEPKVIPADQTEHKVNYFRGNDKSRWRTNIQTSKAILYRDLYENIDLKVYGIERQIEYDFVVKPGGEVLDIRFEYKDVDSTRIDEEGNLVIEIDFGQLAHAKPVCYQIIEGKRIDVDAEYREIDANSYGFEVKEYAENYELILDPLVLVYSTYLGGSGEDSGFGIAVDSEGAAYVTGDTMSLDFPTQNSIQRFHLGWGEDVFITKLNPSGTSLVYSTYFGGSAEDLSKGIAVDSEGAAYVVGDTWSYDFPIQNPIPGGLGGSGWGQDIFITKIDASGSVLVYSDFLGENHSSGRLVAGDNYCYGLALDLEGAAYVLKEVEWCDSCTQVCLFYDLLVTKVDSSGKSIAYSHDIEWTDQGGISYAVDIAVDSEGAAYVLGDELSFSDDVPEEIRIYHIYRISPSGEGEYMAVDLPGGNYIAVDTEDAIYVAGETSSSVFIAKFGTFNYLKYLEGSEGSSCRGIAVDSEGAAYVAGNTYSDDFALVSPIQDKRAGGQDVFIAKLDPEATEFKYSTYLGGSGRDTAEGIAVDSWGTAYVTGSTVSLDFPTKNPVQGSIAGSSDAFISKLCTTYSLTLVASIGGTIDPAPGTYDYCAGSKVAITAIPDWHYRFSHWSGDASGISNPITITIDSDISVTGNFIRIIYPPTNLAGDKVLNRSLSQAEYINVLSWQANVNNENIQNYRIYTVDGQSRSFLVELNASTFEYWHRRVEKDKVYTYAIVAVNDEGREGDPAYVIV